MPKNILEITFTQKHSLDTEVFLRQGFLFLGAEFVRKRGVEGSRIVEVLKQHQYKEGDTVYEVP